MSVTITSTTDTPEAVAAASGLAKEPSTAVETKSASEPEEAADETADESETSETEEVPEKSENEDAEPNEDESTEKSDDKPKKKGGFQKRIDKVTREKSEAERERDYWKQQALNSAKSPNANVESKSEHVETSSDEPQADQFDTHAAYVKAMVRWDRETVEREAQAKVVATEQDAALKSHVARVESFKESHDDFDDVLASVDDIVVSHAALKAIADLDDGPAVMYALAQDREEYERISKLSPQAQILAVGRFAAKVEISPAPTAKSESKQVSKVSKAPAPVKTIGSKTSASSKSPDDMSFQEYKRWHAKEFGPR